MLFCILSSVTGTLLSNMFKSPQSRPQAENIAPLDKSSQQLATLALNCLSHLFSWIPLSSTITPSLLNTIFHYVGFGCDPLLSKMGSSSHQSAIEQGSHSVGVLAMCCINELLSKNCVPQEFEDYLLQLFQQTFYLLQRLTKEGTGVAGLNSLKKLDEK